MPKLSDLKIDVHNEVGDDKRFIVPASVSTSGRFTLNVPDDLAEIVQAEFQNRLQEMRAKEISITSHNPIKLMGNQMQPLTDFIHACAKIYIKVDTKIERVIVFTSDLSYRFVLAEGQAFGDYNQAGRAGLEDQASWEVQEGRNALFSGDSVMTGLALAVGIFDKHTYTRGSSVTYKYISCRSKLNELQGDSQFAIDAMSNLISSTGVSTTDLSQTHRGVNGNIHPRGQIVENSPYNEMPLTDENAVFFSELLNALRLLSYKANKYLSKPNELALMIANGTANLLGMKP